MYIIDVLYVCIICRYIAYNLLRPAEVRLSKTRDILLFVDNPSRYPPRGVKPVDKVVPFRSCIVSYLHGVMSDDALSDFVPICGYIVCR